MQKRCQNSAILVYHGSYFFKVCSESVFATVDFDDSIAVIVSPNNLNHLGIHVDGVSTDIFELYEFHFSLFHTTVSAHITSLRG